MVYLHVRLSLDKHSRFFGTLLICSCKRYIAWPLVWYLQVRLTLDSAPPGLAPALLVNIRVDCKSLLSYLASSSVMNKQVYNIEFIHRYKLIYSSLMIRPNKPECMSMLKSLFISYCCTGQIGWSVCTQKAFISLLKYLWVRQRRNWVGLLASSINAQTL
jgi:hypothetical protein